MAWSNSIDEPMSPAGDGTGSVTDAPADVEVRAERGLLAVALRCPDVVEVLVERLSVDDFGAAAHQELFAAILACEATGRAVDAVTVSAEMQRAGIPGRSGGAGILDALVPDLTAVESVDAYIEIVLERSLRRRMLRASRTIGAAALNPRHEVTHAVDLAEREVLALTRDRRAASLSPIAAVLARTQEEMSRARDGVTRGHPSGLKALDELIGGFRGGQLVIIAARPGMGKSVLGLQTAINIASSDPSLVVPIFSYEMTSVELGLRLLSATSGLPLSQLARGQLPYHEGADRLLAAQVAKLEKLQLLIDDRPPESISGLRSAVRRIAKHGRLGAVVVDYIQLIAGEAGRRDENRQQEVASISRSLKLMAVEFDVPVIAISQLSRALESRPNKRPIPSDLRESGALEQDASLILGLYREWVYDRTADDKHAELLVLKNRQGPLGQVAVDFDGACVRFQDSDRHLGSGTGTSPGSQQATPRPGFGANAGVVRDLF